VCSCSPVCVLLRTRHPQVCLLRQLHGWVRMRLRALGRSEVQPKVGGFSGVRAHQTSVVEALGSVQGSRGSSSVQGLGRRVFGRGACLTRADGRSRSGLGTTLWLCSVVSARQGKARQGASGKAKASRLRLCGSPRALVCRKGRCSGRWRRIVRDGEQWRWRWWSSSCLYV
jgi:hypothetical protein